MICELDYTEKQEVKCLKSHQDCPGYEDPGGTGASCENLETGDSNVGGIMWPAGSRGPGRSYGSLWGPQCQGDTRGTHSPVDSGWEGTAMSP